MALKEIEDYERDGKYYTMDEVFGPDKVAAPKKRPRKTVARSLSASRVRAWIPFAGPAPASLASVPIRERLRSAIDALAKNPRPRGCLKLLDRRNLYRIRVGKYRVIYEIRDRELIVLIVRVAKRAEDTYEGV